MAVDSTSLKQRMERKASFQSAMRDLEQALKQSGTSPELEELLPLVARCHTLLKARYSSPAYWRLGRSLFEAATAATVSDQFDSISSKAIQARLPGFIADADRFLADDVEQPAARQTLGELLLGLPPPQATPSHLSDAGLLLDAPPPAPAAAAASAAVGQQPPPLAAPAPEQVEQLLQRFQQQLAGQQQGQQQQQQPGDSQQGQQQQAGDQGQVLPPTTPEDQAMLIELLAGQLPRPELEALLQQLTEPGGSHHQAKPAASKRVVASLPVLQLTDEAAMARVGGPDTACPVCTETLRLGDSVQQLPCSTTHVFHVPCLAPWLQQNNSCPVCRHELPTDDHAYEAQKERAAEEAEAQRGAANALSHNEFAYI